MKIGISLNEVLRDFIGQFIHTYKKYVAPETNLSTSFDLLEHFDFETKDKLNNFLYLEAALEIFGHADQMSDGLINQFNVFLSDLEYDGEHEVELVSREVSKAIPSTFFFLSKTGARPNNVRFVKDYAKKWDGLDVLITASPKALAAKPSDKISVKVNTPYNTNSKADYEIDSILDFFKDADLRKTILTKIITTTYEEIK